MFLNNRYYDPTLSKFLSVDPMGRQVGRADTYVTTPQHWNPYSYAGGNPTTQSDPSGLCGAPEVCNPDGSTHDSHVDFEVAKLQPGGGRDGYYLEHNTCGLCTALELFNWGNTDPGSLAEWHDAGMKVSDHFNKVDPGDTPVQFYANNWRTWTYLAAAGTCIVASFGACAWVTTIGVGVRGIATVTTHGPSADSAKTIGIDAALAWFSLALVGAPMSQGTGALVSGQIEPVTGAVVAGGAEFAPAVPTVIAKVSAAAVATGDVACGLKCPTWFGRS